MRQEHQEALVELERLVRDMRHHQLNYFRTRDHCSLDSAKKAEKAVDLQLRELEQINGASLF